MTHFILSSFVCGVLSLFGPFCDGTGSFESVSGRSIVSNIVSTVSGFVFNFWVCARLYKRMDNLGVFLKCSNMKWCHSIPSAWIQLCPALEEFLNDIQASPGSSMVKWRPTPHSSRIHRDALIQPLFDEIQFSVLGCIVNGSHFYSLRIFFFRLACVNF